MRTHSFLLTVPFLLIPLAGCSDASDAGGESESGGSGGGSSFESGSATGSASGGAVTEGPENGAAEPGQLTAGEWDDNVNFDWFLDYRSTFLQQSHAAALPIEDRVVLQIVDPEGAAVAGANVTVEDDRGALFEGPVDGFGEALYFPRLDGEPSGDPRVSVTWPGGDAPLVVAAPAASPWVITIPDRAARPTEVDVAFVIDTTGSMADEADYIKAEVEGIAARVALATSQASVRWALIVYRDVGDDYVTRSFDFGDLASLRSSLAEQSVDGGGDEPEALQAALGATTELSWRGGNVARLAFVVADAPSHEGADEEALFGHVDALRRRGVKLVPVAASGTSPWAEYQLRSAAQATLGRYLFLTDDSGIGSSHAEPTIPCYFVQHLDDLVVRAVASEVTGARSLPAQADIVRSVGSPDADGVCHLEGGGTAQL